MGEDVNRFVTLVGVDVCLSDAIVYAALTLLRSGLPLDVVLGRTVAALAGELYAVRRTLISVQMSDPSLGASS